jgi:hypothetical protein
MEYVEAASAVPEDTSIGAICGTSCILLQPRGGVDCPVKAQFAPGLDGVVVEPGNPGKLGTLI